jgi:hypothetical protein
LVFDVLSLDLHILKLDLLLKSFRLEFFIIATTIKLALLEPTFELKARISILRYTVEVSICGSPFHKSLLHLEHLSLALMVHLIWIC